MSSRPEFEFDDAGGSSSVFLASLLAIYLVPATFIRFRLLLKSFADRNLSEDEKRSRARLEKKEKSISTTWHVVYGVVLLLFFILAFVGSQTAPQGAASTFDPYQILEIDQDATEAQIKESHKKLRLKYHPDKNRGHEEEAREKYEMVDKAFKTLTDPKARDNWEKYDNPDGPQQMKISMGIALPKFLSQKENGILILLLYFVILGSILFALWRWWGRSKKESGGVLQSSVDKLGQWMVYLYRSTHKKNTTTPLPLARIIECLPYLPEFKSEIKVTSEDVAFLEKHSNPKKTKEFIKFFNPFNPDSEEAENGEQGENEEEKKEKKKEKVDGTTPEGIKVGLYLNCHLFRLEVPEPLKKEYNFAVSKTLFLLKKATEMGAHLQDVDFILKGLTMTQLFVQAIWAGEYHQLQQLPHFDEFELSKKKTKIDTISKFQMMPEDDRKVLLKNLSPEKYAQVLEAAAQIPRVTILNADFVVLDEKVATVGDMITFICKFHVSYGLNVPEPKKTKGVKTSEEFTVERDREVERQKTSASDVIPVHAPHLHEARESNWWIILGQKEKLVSVNYIPELTTVDTLMNGTTIFVSFSIQRAKTGLSAFKVYVVSDSYLGVSDAAAVELRQEKQTVEKKTKSVPTIKKGPPPKVLAKKSEAKKDGNEEEKEKEDSEEKGETE